MLGIWCWWFRDLSGWNVLAWLGWNHWIPWPRWLLARKSPAWPNLCHLFYQNFQGNFQQSSPNDSRSWMWCTKGWTKEYNVNICVEDLWIKVETVVFVLLKHKISVFFWVWALFLWCGTAQHSRQCKAESGSAPLPQHVHVPMIRSGQRNTTFCIFFSIPALGHNSLFSCCLGPTPLHIPKRVKGRSGSRKEHGKSWILGCYFCCAFWNSCPVFMWKSPSLKSQPCTHNLQHVIRSILSWFD